MNFIDLVLCKHDNGGKFLFQAPKYSLLKEGEKVTVKTRKGEKLVTVVRTLNVAEGSDAYRFIVDACNAYEPLAKVIGRLRYEELHYEEEENE